MACRGCGCGVSARRLGSFHPPPITHPPRCPPSPPPVPVPAPPAQNGAVHEYPKVQIALKELAKNSGTAVTIKLDFLEVGFNGVMCCLSFLAQVRQPCPPCRADPWKHMRTAPTPCVWVACVRARAHGAGKAPGWDGPSRPRPAHTDRRSATTHATTSLPVAALAEPPNRRRAPLRASAVSPVRPSVSHGVCVTSVRWL